jgi:tetratricopeptide (TPR) repeat protein
MSDDQSLFDQALAAARRKDYAKARNFLIELLRQNPKHLDGWLLAGHVVEKRADAINCYQRVLELDPNHAYAMQELSKLQNRSHAAVPDVPPATIEKPTVQPPTHRPAISPVTSPKPNSQQPAAFPVSSPRTDRQAPAIQPAGATASKPHTGKYGKYFLGVAAGLVVMLCLVVLGITISRWDEVFLNPAAPAPTHDELFNVLYSNARAANDENVPAYMATIHPESPSYNQTERALTDAFAQYDLEFWFFNLSVTKLTSKEAHIHFSLSTKKIRGPAFRDNIVTGTMILRLDNGIWKIYNQEVEYTIDQ